MTMTADKTKTKKLMPREPKLSFREAQAEAIKRHGKTFKQLAAR
jgi:hypothetical protein